MGRRSNSGTSKVKSSSKSLQELNPLIPEGWEEVTYDNVIPYVGSQNGSTIGRNDVSQAQYGGGVQRLAPLNTGAFYNDAIQNGGMSAFDYNGGYASNQQSIPVLEVFNKDFSTGDAAVDEAYAKYNASKDIKVDRDKVQAAKDKEKIDKLNKQIDYYNNFTTGDAAIDEVMGTSLKESNAKKQQKIEQIENQTLAENEDDYNTISKWLEADYDMSKAEKIRAKKIIQDYENKNINANFLTNQADKDKAERISALKDKVSKTESSVYGSMNATPAVDALMKLGDQEYKGWTNEDLANEVDIRKPELSEDQAQAVSLIDQQIESIRNQKSNITLTGDAGIDEASAINEENEKRSQIYDLERQKYIIMLGKQYDGESYGYTQRKENAQTENKAAYLAGDLATRAAETAALQGIMGGTKYGQAVENYFGDSTLGNIAADMAKDAPVDLVTDTLPEYMSNLASGMSTEDANKQALINIAVNLGIGASVATAQNVDIDSLKQAIRNILPEKVAKGEITEDAVKEIDNILSSSENVLTNNTLNDIPKVEGEITNGSTINGTTNQGNIRPEELVKSGTEFSGNLETGRAIGAQNGGTSSVRNVVSPELSAKMDSAGVNNFGLKDTTNDKNSFVKQLDEAKKSNPNGFMVDSKTEAELEEHGAKLFSDDSRTVGVAVEKDGNIVAVHKNPSNTAKGAVDDLIITARENGGTKMDCYGSGLVRKYENDGFTPVARIPWNEEYRPDDWLGDGKDVFVMMRDNRTTEQVLDDITNGTVKHLSTDELNNLPVFEDYDEALKYRDDLLAKQTENQGAFFNAQNTLPSVDGSTEKFTTENVYNLPEVDGSAEQITGNNVNNALDDYDIRQDTTIGNQNPETGKEKLSAMYDNTLQNENQGVFTDAQKGAYQPEEFSYLEAGEDATLVVANRNLQNFENCEKTYLNGKLPRRHLDGADCDTMMGMVRRYNADAETARLAGNLDEAKYLESKAQTMYKKIYQAAHKYGQFNQALAKYTRQSAENAISITTMLKQGEVESIVARNAKLGKAADTFRTEVSSDIDDLWAELEAGSLTNTTARETTGRTLSDIELGQIEHDINNVVSTSDTQRRIEEIIRQRVEQSTNSTLRRNMTDTTIQRVARQMAYELETDGYISNALDVLYDAGVSGFAGIDDTAASAVRAAFDEAKKYNYGSKDWATQINRAYATLADATEMTGSFADKVKSWRYMAMLGKPTVVEHNALGNTGTGIMTTIKNDIGTALEHAFIRDPEKRTKAFATRFTETDAYKTARKLADDLDYLELTQNGGMYSKGVSTTLQSNAKVFNQFRDTSKGVKGTVNKGLNAVGKALNKTDDIVSASLDDYSIWMKDSYADHLVQYLKSHKVGDVDNYLKTANVDDDLFREARQYAIEQAQKATFHTQTKVGQALQKLEDSGTVGRVLVGGIMPFKNTPANIVKTIASYSPLNSVKIGMDIMDMAKGGSTTAAELIDDIAETITGTSMAMLGYSLAKKGVLTAESTMGEGDHDATTGKLSYALHLGDNNNFNIDLANVAPFSTPLLSGAAFYQGFKGSSFGEEMQKVFDAIADNDLESAKENLELTKQAISDAATNYFDPIVETSMLSSVSDALTAAKYADTDEDSLAAFKAFGRQAATNYFGQFVPSAVGGVSRGVDDKKYSTYSGKDYESVSGTASRILNKAKNAIPYANKLLENSEDLLIPFVGEEKAKEISTDLRNKTSNYASVDGWGRDKTYYGGQFGDSWDNALGRTVIQELSPVTMSKTEKTKNDTYLEGIENEIRSAEKASGNIVSTDFSGLYPSEEYNNSFNYKQEKINLTPEQNHDFAVTKGTMSEEFIDSLRQSEAFNSITDPQARYQAIEEAYKVAEYIAQSEVIGEDYDHSGQAYKAYLDGDVEGLTSYLVDSAKAAALGTNLTEAKREILAEEGEEGLAKYVESEKVLKDNGIKSTEFTRSLYDAEGDAGLNKYKMVQDKAAEYGITDVTEKMYNEYIKKGATDGAKYMKAYAALKEAGFSTSEANINLYNNGGGIKAVQENSNLNEELGQIQKGYNEYGDPTYYSTADKKATEIYLDTGSEDMMKAYTSLSSDAYKTNSAKIEQLEYSYEDFSDEDRGYLLSQTMGTPAKKAKEFLDAGNYEDFYYYYLIKDAVDANGNGSLTKKEKAQIIPYLKANGFDSSSYKEIEGWYK